MLLIISLILIAFIVSAQVLGTVFNCYSLKGLGLSMKIRHFLYPGACFLIMLVRRFTDRVFPWKKQGDVLYYEKIYVGGDIEKIRRDDEAGMVALGMFVIIFAAATVTAIRISGLYDDVAVESIVRPERGNEDYHITAEYDDGSYELDITVDEVVPPKGEMLDRLDACEELIESEIKGRNDSLENVIYNLVLRDYYEGPGVKADWSCSDRSLIYSDGTVNNEELSSSRGVLLTVKLTCFGESREKNFVVMVMPPDKDTANENFLIESFEELLEKNKEKREVELPDEIKGQSVSFVNKKEDKSGLILLLGIFVVLLLPPLWFENKRNKLRERDNQMLCDYSDVLGKFVMLLESGQGIRAAFERIAADYEGRRTEKSKRYVLEEMIKTRNEIYLGTSEALAYEGFGRRCGSIYYIRFAALLTQSVKKGGESLVPKLRKEMSEAIRDRRQTVRKKGEEASMKLLLPMMGMFSIVLAIILIPAFLSM